MRTISTAVALATLLSACSAATAGTHPEPSRTDSRVLTGDDLRHPVAHNAFDLIRLLRPQYLQFGRPSLGTERAVYVDGQRTGDIQDLRLVPADVIREIRFLSGPEANFRYGLDHSAGAIVVTTRVPPRRGCPGCR